MFQMEERKDLIRFEYSGVAYAMTETEIEAAYRYQQQKYRRMDAKDALESVFNTDNPDCDIPEEDLHKHFIARFGITYDYALEHIDTLIDMHEKWDDWDIALIWLKSSVDLEEKGEPAHD